VWRDTTRGERRRDEARGLRAELLHGRHPATTTASSTSRAKGGSDRNRPPVNPRRRRPCRWGWGVHRRCCYRLLELLLLLLHELLSKRPFERVMGQCVLMKGARLRCAEESRAACTVKKRG
jgi:hypothetical protein